MENFDKTNTDCNNPYAKTPEEIKAEELEEKKYKHKKLVFEETNNVVGWFERMIVMIDRYGWKKIITTILAIAFTVIMVDIYYTIKTQDLIAKAFTTQINEHNKGMNKRYEVDPQIRNNLTRLLYETNASRVYVLETHNGNTNHSGLPFSYADMTYEELKDGVSEVSNEYKDISASKYPIFLYLEEHLSFVGTIDELRVIDKKIANRMEINDANFVGLKILQGLDMPLGILGVTFNDSVDVTDQFKGEVYKYMEKYGGTIGLLLDRSYEKK